MLVPGAQQCESATCTHIPLPSWASLPPNPHIPLKCYFLTTVSQKEMVPSSGLYLVLVNNNFPVILMQKSLIFATWSWVIISFFSMGRCWWWPIPCRFWWRPSEGLLLKCVLMKVDIIHVFQLSGPPKSPRTPFPSRWITMLMTHKSSGSRAPPGLSASPPAGSLPDVLWGGCRN